jgi:SAM-dependent methyltransferase
MRLAHRQSQSPARTARAKDMSHDDIRSQIGGYYSNKITAHGPTARGVDWNSAESQRLRFCQLAKVFDCETPFSINDYGCGYGAFVDHLVDNKLPFTYRGFDISDEMISAARQLHPTSDRIAFVTRESELGPADYTVASGIFNVRLQSPENEWKQYVLDTLHSINDLSQKGFSFNVQTRYSDSDLMRPNLYYADPGFLFDYCKTRFSRFVALLHDYPLYEFTILVRRQ